MSFMRRLLAFSSEQRRFRWVCFTLFVLIIRSEFPRLQPSEVKWKLMVASCHRRMAAYNKALELYEEIHAAHPDNIECEQLSKPTVFLVSHNQFTMQACVIWWHYART
jgi:hypothetical protein